MTELNKEREAFLGFLRTKGVVKVGWNSLGVLTNLVREAGCTLSYNDIELMQEVWMEKAKAQAVPEHIVTLQRNGEVFKFDLLDLLRRSLKSSKVLKTRENWSHVSKMVGIGSTTSTLLCKEMNVDPDGTVFEASESGAEE